MSTLTDDEIKSIISWGSISYAFGFFTILLHTARIGIPVLELVQPIYVWVGAPLAIITYIFLKLIKLLIDRAKKYSNELKDSWKQAWKDTELSDSDLKTFSEFMGVSIAMIPGLNIIPKVTLNFTKTKIEKLLKMIKSKKGHDRLNNIFRRMIALINAAKALNNIIRLCYIPIIIIIIVYFYVWDLYPQIPQSLGGGAPSTVRLAIDEKKLPANFDVIKIKNLKPSVTGGSIFLSEKIRLLYRTKDDFYLQSNDSALISLNKDVIKGVIWSENSVDSLTTQLKSESNEIGFSDNKKMQQIIKSDSLIQSSK